MKNILHLIFIFSFQALIGQSFTEVLPSITFEKVSTGATAVADFNGDGTSDVLLTGENGAGDGVGLLYFGDGLGDYLELSNEFFSSQVALSTISYADVDGDNDLDVVISGQPSAGTGFSTILYLNDGFGKFPLASSRRLEGVNRGATAFADIDGDNDQDLMLIGSGFRNELKAILYTNDGSGRFTEVVGTPFEGITSGDLAFSDVDGDNDLDLLITGISLQTLVTKLYTNDGLGIFTEDTSTAFEPVGFSTVSFTDVDGDNDEDLLLIGRDTIRNPVAILYTNNGSGEFTEMLGTALVGVSSGDVSFVDVDDDSDLDLCIAGQDSNYNPSTNLYLNDGKGIYQKVAAPFSKMQLGELTFWDIDNDNDQDVLITGMDSLFRPMANIYLNDGSGTFSDMPSLPFSDISSSSIDFIDIDQDNDQDVFITGLNSAEIPITKLYVNDGKGVFIEILGTPFEGVSLGKLAFSDMDGDNDLDVLLMGRNASNTLITKLYYNNGSNNFIYAAGISNSATIGGDLVFADLDGDNDSDILITGQTWAGFLLSYYTNDGAGKFTKSPTSTPFSDSLYNINADFGDVDKDGDLDVICSGFTPSRKILTQLLLNDGSGKFTKAIGMRLQPVYSGPIIFEDIDNDNDLDVLTSGIDPSYTFRTYIYKNDGNGIFLLSGNIPKAVSGPSRFGDLDNDGDFDLLTSVENGSRNGTTENIYLNDGSGNFIPLSNSPFIGTRLSSVNFTDIDGDSDLDAILSGGLSNGRASRPFTKLYTNDLVATSIGTLQDQELPDFVLYPNPVDAKSVTLAFTTQFQGVSHIHISDIQGRSLSKYQEYIQRGKQKITLNTTNLEPGTYIIQLNLGKSRLTKKLVIKN
ncbi:MAG: T9SS type A sorting domain-containing protein [Bacteroidia bacterium]